MDLGETGLVGVDWIGLAQDRDKWRALVNVVMNLRDPLNAGKVSSGYTTGGLWSSAQLNVVSYTTRARSVNSRMLDTAII
jgi:hypothetical protein